jgi:hypothetical protein
MDFKLPVYSIFLLSFLLIAAGVMSSKLAVKKGLNKSQMGKVLKQVGTPFV